MNIVIAIVIIKTLASVMSLILYHGYDCCGSYTITFDISVTTKLYLTTVI